MGNRNPELDRMLTEMETAHWGYEMRPLIHESMMLLDEIVETADNSVTDKANAVEELAKTITGKVGISDNVIGTATTWSSEKINAENSALADSYKPQLASGETLDLVTAKGGVKLDKVVGKTYKSKNLLKSVLTSRTQRGVTITDLGNGTYSVSGTVTENTWVYFLGDYAIQLEIKEPTKLVGCPSGGSNSKYYLMAKHSNGNWYFDYGNGVNLPIGTYNNFGISFVKDAVLNNVVFKPMLTTDLTATYDDFEPYGLFSSGSMGLVDLGSLNWTKYTSQGGKTYYSSNGISTNIQKNINNNTVYPYRIVADNYTLSSLTTNATFTSTTTPNNVFTVSADGSLSIYSDKLPSGWLSYEIADGATPSQYAEVITEQNHNLFLYNNYVSDSSRYAKISATLEFLSNEIKVTSQSASSTNNFSGVYVGSSIVNSLLAEYNGETITLSAMIKGLSGARLRFGLDNTNKFVTLSGEWEKVSIPIVFDSTKTNNHFSLYYQNVAVGTVMEIKDIQFELGAVATNYQPHMSNTLFLPLSEPLYGGNYIDEDGLHVNYGALDLGSPTWEYIASWGNGGGLFSSSSITTLKKASSNIEVVDVRTEDYTTMSRDANYNSVANYNISISTTGAIQIRDPRFNNLNDFVNHIKGKMLIYPLATPTLIPLTPSQAKAMASLVSFEGKTYIDTADVYAKPTLDVTYGKTDVVAMTIENGNKADYNRALIEELINS